jgi:inner membrane protein
MMLTVDYWHWWILGCILLIFELLLPGVFFMWPAIAAGLMGFLLLILPQLSFPMQVFIFALVSAFSVAAWHWYMRKHPVESQDPLLNQRLARYVGRTVVLVEPIVNGSGRARIDDSWWKVIGPDCPVGSAVKIIGTDNSMLLRVEPVDTQSAT